MLHQILRNNPRPGFKLGTRTYRGPTREFADLKHPIATPPPLNIKRPALEYGDVLPREITAFGKVNAFSDKLDALEDKKLGIKVRMNDADTQKEKDKAGTKEVLEDNDYNRKHAEKIRSIQELGRDLRGMHADLNKSQFDIAKAVLKNAKVSEDWEKEFGGEMRDEFLLQSMWQGSDEAFKTRILLFLINKAPDNAHVVSKQNGKPMKWSSVISNLNSKRHVQKGYLDLDNSTWHSGDPPSSAQSSAPPSPRGYAPSVFSPAKLVMPKGMLGKRRLSH